MAAETNKLQIDLEILEQMTAGMLGYLTSSSVYSKKIDHDLMYLTLGGYFMRRHRLTALSHLLSKDQRDQLQRALDSFDQLRRIHQRDVERKAQQELQSRLREWDRALRELLDEAHPSLAFYRTDVEKRVMIASLVRELQAESALIRPELLRQLQRLDQSLQQRWQPGPFIWPPEWEAAYPQEEYWWLYGAPR